VFSLKQNLHAANNACFTEIWNQAFNTESAEIVELKLLWIIFKELIIQAVSPF
jgi:hypothetical protein